MHTDLADEGKGLPPHPLGTVAEPDGELVDEVQAQVISTTCIQLLEDLYNLKTQEVAMQSLRLIIMKAAVKTSGCCSRYLKEHFYIWQNIFLLTKTSSTSSCSSSPDVPTSAEMITFFLWNDTICCELTSLYEIHLTSETLSEHSVSAICLR